MPREESTLPMVKIRHLLAAKYNDTIDSILGAAKRVVAQVVHITCDVSAVVPYGKKNSRPINLPQV